MTFNIVVEWTAVTFLCLVNPLSSKFCSYQSDGIQWVDCPQTCCEVYLTKYSESDVCCGSKYYGAYIGGAVAAIVSLAVVVLCLTYSCCKKRLARARQQNLDRRQNTRPLCNDVIPSVSLNIEPTPISLNIEPPPYSLLPPPPPYYPTDSQTGSSGKSDNKSSYPDHPPPDYAETSPEGK